MAQPENSRSSPAPPPPPPYHHHHVLIRLRSMIMMPAMRFPMTQASCMTMFSHFREADSVQGGFLRYWLSANRLQKYRVGVYTF